MEIFRYLNFLRTKQFASKYTKYKMRQNFFLYVNKSLNIVADNKTLKLAIFQSIRWILAAIAKVRIWIRDTLILEDFW